jgi:hypothetical protein
MISAVLKLKNRPKTSQNASKTLCVNLKTGFWWLGGCFLKKNECF